MVRQLLWMVAQDYWQSRADGAAFIGQKHCHKVLSESGDVKT